MEQWRIVGGKVYDAALSVWLFVSLHISTSAIFRMECRSRCERALEDLGSRMSAVLGCFSMTSLAEFEKQRWGHMDLSLAKAMQRDDIKILIV